MTNTYKHDAPVEEKVAEELRLIRCLMERIFRHMANEDLFVDYEMEKFNVKFFAPSFKNGSGVE